MTKDQVKDFEELYRLFYNKCTFITACFSDFDNEFSLTDTYALNDNLVECTGIKYLGYGEYDTYYREFDAKWLTASLEEIKEYAKTKKLEKENEYLKKKLETEAKQRERELAEYERLKAKYEPK